MILLPRFYTISTIDIRKYSQKTEKSSGKQFFTLFFAAKE